MQGRRGVDPDKHVRLGYLPKLTSYQAQDVLELTPAVLHDIISLKALQVQARLRYVPPCTACLL